LKLILQFCCALVIFVEYVPLTEPQRTPWLHIYITASQKQQDIDNSCPYLCQVLTDFQFLSLVPSRKLVIRRSLQILQELGLCFPLGFMPTLHPGFLHIASFEAWRGPWTRRDGRRLRLVAGPRVWNTLLEDITTSQSLSTF